MIFTMEEIAELAKEITVEGRVKSVLHNSKYAGLIVTDQDEKEKHFCFMILRVTSYWKRSLILIIHAYICPGMKSSCITT